MLPEVFINHWAKAEANERANSQPFLLGLTQLLGVDPPSNSHADGYSFEYPVKVPGTSNTNFIDLYKRSHFVLESKQYTAKKEEQSMLQLAALKAGVVEEKKKSGPLRGTGAWDDAMLRAKGQAERYVRSLPAEEPNPPFLLVCDVGHTIEVYADFTQNGKAYLPFPDPRTFRIRLKDLAKEKIRERLHLIWTNPTSLDPSKVSADVTREIAGYLAELAKSLEQAGHEPEVVAQFLTRCLFCMFAEDVGLLPERSFTDLLASVPGDGTGFEDLLGTLFREMNHGTGKSISVVLRKKLLRFNGGLFVDHTVLPVNGMQLGLLKQAAKANWRNVEPAIFGTLLERALVPEERHALGAHFTPRAYVERLVLPTVMEPLREEWESIRIAAITLANKDDMKGARKLVNEFHDRLCEVTVLDPACGSGNFLYVALEHMKRLEGEVIDLATDLGVDQRLDLTTHTVDPHQFLGIELNPRAAAIAELVLWIGYLQWHFRTRGQTLPEEPVLKTFKNIECRDAVLEYDGEPEPARDEHGHIRTVWDRRSYKTDLVTNRDVPDESKRVPLLTYKNPRPAKWPKADFIVGNPPFIGTKRMRENLSDGYVDMLRKAYTPHVEDNADFVMYWWHQAAKLLQQKRIRRFGLITTNSLRQSFSRRLVEKHLGAQVPISLAFAIPDHPWVDSQDGADVRISITVAQSGRVEGTLAEVVSEIRHSDGTSSIEVQENVGMINAGLTIGADSGNLTSLRSNEGLCGMGIALHGSGFLLTPEEAKAFIPEGPSVIRRFISGSDITKGERERYVIDFSFLSEEDAHLANKPAFQHVLTHVKPERMVNRRDPIRINWWRFGWERPVTRKAINGLSRYIATCETAKHRFFVFLNHDVLPEHKLVVIGSEDALHLGVLSSRLHVTFALSTGALLEDRPVYPKTQCFDPFPFPLCGEEEKNHIRALAEELDAHRKRAQEKHRLSLTSMYNVLEKLRAGETLTEKDKGVHDRGLISILKQLHDDLDAAVFAAYGWPTTLTDAEILERLVALNAQRAAEEKRGIIHWLRPEYQNPTGQSATQGTLKLPAKKSATKKAKTSATPAPKGKIPWPKPLAERIRVTEQALHAAGHAVTAEELAKRFSRANPKDVLEILDSLLTLGRGHRNGDKFSA